MGVTRSVDVSGRVQFGLSECQPLDESTCQFWNLPLFNPGHNRNQVSVLRIISNAVEGVEILIRGERQDGTRNQEGGEPLEIRGTVPPGAAVEMTSDQLETGDNLPLQGATGRLGDPQGKWNLTVFSARDAELVLVNLMRTRTGHLVNLSDHPTWVWIVR